MHTSQIPTLASALPVAHILVRPAEESRQAVVRELVQLLVESGQIDKSQSSTVMRLINDREALGSTAIGGGIALPHCRANFVDHVVAGFALLQNGSGFQPLDGAPVKLVLLIVSPKSDDQLHIGFLKSASRFLNHQIHRKALTGCKTAADVQGVFADYA